MAGTGFPPPFIDIPELSSLQFPWSTPPVVDPAAVPAVAAAPVPPPVELAPAVPLPPPEPELALHPPPPPAFETLPSLVPPPPAAPDALSGVAGMPATGELGGVPYAPTRTPEQLPEATYRAGAQKLAESPFDPATGDIRADVDDADARRYFEELRHRDPQGYVEVKAKFEDLKTKHALAQREKIIDQDWQQQQANMKTRQAALEQARAKSAQIEADAQKLADTKVDPVGGIGAVLMGIIGGLIQGKTGSPTNQGIEALKGVMQQRLELHRVEMGNRQQGLASRRSALAMEFDRIGDEYQAMETVRLATLKHADDVLATEQINYAPRGTTFLRIADMRGQVAAEMQKSQAERDQKLFDNGLKFQEAARKQEESDAQIQKTRAETAKLFAEASSSKVKDELLTPDQIRARFPELPVAAVPPVPMTLKTLENHVETYNKSLTAKGKTRENDPHEINIERAVPGVVDDKGNLVRFASREFANDVSTAKETADEITRLTDELIRMVEKNGWSSDFVKSEEWRKAKQNYNEILIKKKEQDKLGVLTGPDVGIVTKEIGTEDPTEVRGQGVVAALKNFRHNQIEGFNAKIRNKAIVPEGRSLKRWEPPPPPAPTVKTDRDKAIEAALGRTSDVTLTPFTPSGDVRPARPARAPSSRAGEGAGREIQDKLVYQLEVVDMLATEAQSSDPEVRERGLADLAKFAGDDQNPAGARDAKVRDRARQLLINIAGSGIVGSPEEVR